MTEEQLALPGLPVESEIISPPRQEAQEKTPRKKRRHQGRRHTAAPRQDYDPTQGWYVPVQVMAMGDGTYTLRTGRPVQRGNTEAVSRATGVHRKVLHRLADIGLIKRQRPTPFTSFFYYAEIEELLKRTQDDPNFWDSIKKEAYLNGNNLLESHAK